MKIFQVILIFSISAALLSTGCSKHDHDHDEEELITTLIYQLTSESDGSMVEMSFRDLDGSGGNPPVITGGILKPNHSYKGTITVLNESVSPVEDITMEVSIAATAHQFFFASTVSGLTVSYEDNDKDGRPLGLKTRLSTGPEGSGTLKIVLRHNPNKSAAGVSEGNIANAGGETDIEVNFPVTVQ
jgi:hypothetical protein